MWLPFARVKATLLKGICGVFLPGFGSFAPDASVGEAAEGTEGAGVGVDVGGWELFIYWLGTDGVEVSFRFPLLAAIASSIR